MAARMDKPRCIMCGKDRSAVRCEGCLQIFCYNHLTDHRQELNKQLDEIEVNQDIFRQTLTQQTTDPKQNSLIKQIDKWEEDSIKKIQQTAKECKELLFQYTTEHVTQIKVDLNKLTEELRQIRQENDFNEIDLDQFKEKLTQLTKELDQPSNVSIQQDSASLVKNISVVVSSGKCVNF
jgi:chromosome segregation ATPase